MAVPAWKAALLEKKKQQEAEAKAKEAQAEEAKLACLPAWKRAILLREKQAKGGDLPAKQDPANTPALITPSKTSSKWQVAVERVKGPDSPILNQKQKWKDANSCTNHERGVPGSSLKPVSKLANEVFSTPSSPVSKPEGKPAAGSPVLQRWKHSASSSGNTAKPAVASAPLLKPSLPKTNVPAATQPPSNLEDDDPALAVMPPWKRALILKKRKHQQKPVSAGDTDVANRQSIGVDEPDSVSAGTDVTPSAPKASGPEVVNRRDTEDTETVSNRLVEREGKTLHAPVYKEVDEWANVKEEDDKFQNLPLWKQALIKRRRADIAKRSGLPVPEHSTPPSSQAKVSSPLAKKAALEKKNKATNGHTSTKKNNEQNRVGGRNSSSSHKTKTSNKTASEEPVKKAPAPIKRDDFKPTRKAPRPPPAKKDSMFTYNFSKSTHHTLDTGGTSSDSTDSELEDAVVTNLDESSDEADSGIVLQHYTVNKPSSPGLGQKSHSESSVGTPSAPPSGKKSRKVSACVSYPITLF
jgi:hypothetical protein